MPESIREYVVHIMIRCDNILRCLWGSKGMVLDYFLGKKRKEMKKKCWERMLTNFKLAFQQVL